MRLAAFKTGASRRIGLVIGDEVADVRAADERLPADLCEVLRRGEEALDAVRQAAMRAPRLHISQVRLQAPLQPRKFLGLGMSFRSHVEELRAGGMDIPPHQVWFNKQVTAVTGPYDPIHVPRVSKEVDYEGELALVIGQYARNVRAADASRFIAGYMVCNDVSVREWQRRSPTAMLGKSFDTHGPIGPWLTTAGEVDDANGLRIRTWVDGEVRQDGNTAELIYSFGQMIEELSAVFTLEPGDILTTGTPRGIGASMKPPRFLQAGQRVRIEVEGLGYIDNPVIAEPAGYVAASGDGRDGE